MGEYARSLAIARAASRRWPDAGIRFVLSSAAPYAADVPFPATLVASSPTFHSAPVIELLKQWRPDIVVFDNAGRTAQLRCAPPGSARRLHQRAQAPETQGVSLALDAADRRALDCVSGIHRRQRGSLRVAQTEDRGRPAVRFLDVILARGDAAKQGAILSRTGCQAGAFVLVVPGGGTGHPGASDAADQFRAAARALAAGGTKTVYVGPAGEHAAVGPGADEANWLHLGPLPQDELAELMRAARLVVANGGSTLLQAVACGSARIAVPIAKDRRSASGAVSPQVWQSPRP
jgi:hypothetical protein